MWTVLPRTAHHVAGPGTDRPAHAEPEDGRRQRLRTVQRTDVADGRGTAAQLRPQRVVRDRLGLTRGQLADQPAEPVEQRRDEVHVAAAGQESGLVVAIVAAADRTAEGDARREHVVPVRVDEAGQHHRVVRVDDAQVPRGRERRWRTYRCRAWRHDFPRVTNCPARW